MKVLKYELFAIAILALAAIPSITFAQSNTGLGGPAYALDPNYTLVSGPPVGQICQIGSPPCAVYSQAVYPGWLTPSSYSNWINPFTFVNQSAPSAGGSILSPPYDYQTTFSLAVPGALTARMAADDSACVWAKGVNLATCTPNVGFKRYTYFSVAAASLNGGLNTLDFKVSNLYVVTGLDVEFFCAPQNSQFPNSPLYEDGPGDGTTNTYAVNFGYEVSNSFTSSGGLIQGFCFFFWTPFFPSAIPQTVEVSVTSSPFGGTTYFDQNVSLTCNAYCNSGDPVHGGVCGNNFNDVYACTAAITPFEIFAGTGWLNLQNGVTSTGGALSWDQAGGAGCPGTSCPSSAEDSSLGTIPPESFVIY
jgi:hypothetical protein